MKSETKLILGVLGISGVCGLVAIALLAVFLMSKPSPNPDEPQPGPGPVEPKPDKSPFGAAQVVYDAVMKVKSKGRQSECKQLAAACDKTAQGVDNGQYESCQKVCDAMVAEMSKMPRAWWPAFRDLRDKLQDYQKAGKLKTQARWAILLREIRDGLERSAKVAPGGAGEST